MKLLPRILHWLILIFFALMGVYFSLLGGFLLYLGGSPYYLVVGLATSTIAFWLFKGDARAGALFAIILAVSIPWSWYESDLQLLANLPRLAMWMVLAFWFISPWYRNTVRKGVALSSKWLTLPWIAASVLLLVAALQPYTQVSTGTVKAVGAANPIEDWQHYGNTAGGTRFAELDQIDTDNVDRLAKAWEFRTGVEDDFKMTPLHVNGMVYLCGARNILIAVRDHSGEEVWRFDPQATPPGEHQYARTCRGISYYEVPEPSGGQCDKRIITATIDARMLAVDAMTGAACTSFGDNGAIDLRQGMGEHSPSEYYHTSPPVVADDVLVIGGLVLDNQRLGLPSGVVRAFDAVSGEFAWAWDVGRPGDTTQPQNGETYTPGTPNVWTLMSYDPELDLIYAPTGNANPDYWGGERRAMDDEWSSALVALSGETGQAVWKFQTVYHDVWDFDLPAQPVLVDIERDGETIPAVAVPTKRGDIFVLDRRDGSPAIPIEDRAVPTDGVDGETLSPTQPFSSLPNFHPFRYEKDMWGLTPLDQLLCRVEYKMMRYNGLFTPPSEKGSFFYPANFGGFNWGSVSVDADNGLLVAAPMMLGNRHLQVSPQQVAEAGPRAALLLGEDHPAVRMDPDAPVPELGTPSPSDPYDHLRIKFYGLTLPFMSRFYVPLLGGTQVPCFEPPWSQIAAIDLNSGELMWSRAPGSMKLSGPFGWRSGLPFQVGTPIRAGTLTTRGGLTFLSSTMDSTVRAFDLRSGEVLWQDDLPGSGQATPMSYRSAADGNQYVIVTVPNPSWRYPRDPATGTYTDSKTPRDGKGGYVIAYSVSNSN